MNRLFYELMLHAPERFNHFLHRRWRRFREWWGPWS